MGSEAAVKEIAGRVAGGPKLEGEAHVEKVGGTIRK